MNNTRTVITRDAQLIWRALNGIFAVYKPAKSTISAMKNVIANNIVKDLNKLYVRPPSKYVNIIGETTEKMQVVVQPNLADDVQFVGPRYQPRDCKLAHKQQIAYETSGVLLFGMKDGVQMLHYIHEGQPARTYKVTGKLGIATSTSFASGKLVEQSSYNHIKRSHIDKLCASVQSSHQKSVFMSAGVDMQSQTAYDLAKEGLLRPANKSTPMIYSIKCTNFERPYFDLEIVCINEYENYMKELVDEIGVLLKSSATCTRIQLIQYGLFNMDLALLTKHWTLENIVNNMQRCREILDKNKFLLNQKSPHLVEGIRQ